MLVKYVLFSLFSELGKTEKRKVEVSPPLFKLCTPTSALWYQQQFSAVTQHRQESSMHTNTTMLPLSAHIAYTWFKFVGSEVRHRWIIIIGQT